MEQPEKDLTPVRQEEKLNLFLEPTSETFILPIENKTILHADKAELSEMGSMIVEAVDDGEADGVDTLIMAKKGLYVFENIVEALKGKVALPEVGYSRHNVSMREQQTGVKYDYTMCNDPVWNNLNQQLSSIKEQMKLREDWLKSLKGETTQKIDELSGEVEDFDPPVYPAAKTGGTSLILTLK